MNRLTAVIAAAALIGAGCTPATKEYATPEELQAAMQEEMRKNPPQYLPEIEMAMEEAAALDAMSGETLRSGAFAAKAHPGVGKATIVRKDGKATLVLGADFKTDAGPRLHVFLAGHPDPSSSSDLHAQEALDLGPLKSPSGAQTYDLPEGAADKAWGSVVVYCVPFKVVFTAAALQ
jgi:hypothetical protein